MPTHNLKWNEVDFVECLGIFPSFHENSVLYTFIGDFEDLRLEIRVCHYESLVEILVSQSREKEPFLRISFLVRNEIRYINEKTSAFLEFSDCVVSNRYDPEYFDRDKYPGYTTFEIHSYPRFRLKFS